MSNSVWPHGLYSPGNSPGQNTGVSSLSLLQGIFPTQGSNSGLLHCRWILYLLTHKGSPRILEWVANPFSSGSSRPRNRTGVSCIAGRFLTNWAIREALELNEPWGAQKTRSFTDRLNASGIRSHGAWMQSLPEFLLPNASSKHCSHLYHSLLIFLIRIWFLKILSLFGLSA